MTNNTDEKNFENIQSENSTEEITPTQNTEPITRNQEKNNMEVHHHSHSHGKKNWKNYAWEFLMLFLAVFCGFLAEYKLEHVVEHQREKKYMQMLTEDLKQDTAEYNQKANYIKNILIPAHNKSIKLLFQANIDDSLIKQMYQSIPMSLSMFQILFRDGTALQLKNSGNLRLVENMQVSTDLTNYWSHCSFVTTQLINSYDKTRNASKEMFFSLFNLSNYEENSAFSPLRMTASLKLLSDDKSQLIKFGNTIANMNSQLNGPFLNNLDILNEEASNLIKVINKEYNLK